jgi:hypothetical protein
MNMRRKHTRNSIWLFCIMVLSGCSSLPQFTSERCPNKILLIGDLNEWKGVSAYIDKNSIIAVSVCRDDEFVYVCMTTDDPLTERRIMAGGLTVWFDPSGSDTKSFGINFPLPKNGPGARRGIDNDLKRDAEGNRQPMDPSLIDMEVVGPKETDRYRLPVINSEGIAAHLGRTKDGLMIYELRVPFKKTFSMPHAIEPQNGFMGLGFETGTVKASDEQERNEQGIRPGGLGEGDSNPGGGMGYGRRGGRGRGQYGSSPASPRSTDQLNTWWKIKL